MIYEIRPLIYISGPMLSEGHPYLNIRYGIRLGEFAYKKGWAPIVPHQDILSQMVTGNGELSRYLNVDFAQLAACQAVLISKSFSLEEVNGKKTGCALELDLAEFLGIPIYTVDTLPEATGKISIDTKDKKGNY